MYDLLKGLDEFGQGNYMINGDAPPATAHAAVPAWAGFEAHPPPVLLITLIPEPFCCRAGLKALHVKIHI